MPEFRPLRGMRDLLAEDAQRMIYVEDAARRVARLYGYEEIITPVVESYELLATKAGDEVRSRMFVFKDMGGRDVALRPEFTPSVARLAATSLRNEPKPFRLFCVGSAYRYDEPQRGRYREFWQSDYELIGSGRPEADAESIMLTASLMQKAGLKKFTIRVGHVGVLRGILRQERVGEKEQNAIMQLMDKKQYEDAIKLVEEAGASNKSLKVISQLVECKGTDVWKVVKEMETIVRDYDMAAAAIQNLREILALVTGSASQTEMIVDAGLARGLEYYTGMVFEVFAPELHIALGGGGRYDKLVQLFGGEPTPAVGVAHGLDRIALATQTQKIPTQAERKKPVFMIPINEEMRVEALKIAQLLREAGIAVEVEAMGRKMTKALEDADRRKMDYAIIIGEREVKENAVVVRDLAKRQQRTVKIEKIFDELKD